MRLTIVRIVLIVHLGIAFQMHTNAYMQAAHLHCVLSVSFDHNDPLVYASFVLALKMTK